jgi:ribonuclease P protein component
MLPKKNRLKNKKDFEKIFKDGKGFKEGFLFLKTRGNNLKESRFGFVVSLKVSKKAVVRNRVKRRLREIIKEKLLEVNPGIDAVLIVRKGIEEEDSSTTKETINSLFKKAKILNG